MSNNISPEAKILDLIKKKFDEDKDNYGMIDLETPLAENAFELTDAEKIQQIEKYFKKIMITLGLDLNDDSLKDTPYRVAKMYVKEMFKGLKVSEKPKVSLFENKYQYGRMLVEKNISFHSCCEHHFLPIYGTAHIAYISSGKIIGLSKLHRILNYYAKRPQVQERMTVQIFNELKKVLNTEDVAVYIDAFHLCVSSRGIKDVTSSTVTLESGGVFKEEKKWSDFMSIIKENK